MLLVYVVESMKWSESKKPASYIFAWFITLALISPLLTGFGVQNLLSVLPYQLAIIEERRSWEYGCAWCQLITLRKYLGRRGRGDDWCFLTSSSCWSHYPTVFLWTCPQSDNMQHQAAWLSWLKYLQACRLALLDQPLGLSTSDINNSNNYNNHNKNNNNGSSNNNMCVHNIAITQFWEY